MFVLPGCQPISVNTLLCDTLGLAEASASRTYVSTRTCPILKRVFAHLKRPRLLSKVSIGEGQRGRQKGDGKKNARKCHDKSVPFPSNPILSAEVQKRGKLVREARGPKDKTNGRERDTLS